MAINVGDVYIVGYFGQGAGNAGAGNPSPEGFAVFVKNPIAAGEVLSFTDAALQPGGASFATNEQTINFTIPAGGIAAGTVLQFPLNTANTTNVYANTGGGGRTAIGTITPTGNTGLSNSGDQIFAFQGTLASPTVLAGADVADNSAITTGTTNTNTTYAPTNGAPFLDLPRGTNNAQIAIDPTTATAAQLTDPANYTQNIATTTNPETSFSSIATCFTTGTRIRTVRGNVAVEALVVGDRAVTGAGMTRPITWIGRRDMTCGNDNAPVLIRADAFGPGAPLRDLRLSPGHPVLVGADVDGEGGHLVPIMCLVNGTTVLRETADRVTYWHVELDAHDILLAEGLPAESYLDWGDRDFFVEGADHALANPDFVVPGLGARCRPVAIDGEVVERERRRLETVLATRIAKASAWPEGATAF